MPTEMLSKKEHRARLARGRLRVATERNELRAAARRYEKRERRFKANAAAWILGTILLTALWIAVEWNANGAFERFAHEGNPGDWNPTLWALAVGIWGLVVGIMGLQVHFERTATATSRLKFHVSAWVLGMLMLTPLSALIEWQDNGSFERLSSDSQPGSWDPWVLYVGGIWALGIAALAALGYARRFTSHR